LRAKRRSRVGKKAFIGLGSNLGDRVKNIKTALKRLDSLPGTSLSRVSELAETDPVGLTEQPKFINAVAAIRTELAPSELLQELKAIERQMGRGPSIRWGPRLIDLDILLYDREVVDSRGLTIPHAELENRKFVLEGLVELDPELVNPRTGESLAGILEALRSG